MEIKMMLTSLVVHILVAVVSGGLPVEGESSIEGCLQQTFSGGEWGPWTMRQECTQIIEQQVKNILEQAGCSVSGGSTPVQVVDANKDDAMIMASYGTGVELFIPSRNQTCRLPDTNNGRYGHTVDGLLICGGGHSSDHCVTLVEGSWTRSHSTSGRWCSTSVKIGSSLYLIGGKQEMTADIVDMEKDGETKEGFKLEHGAWWSCAARDLHGDGFLITGGFTDVPGENLELVGSKRAHLYNSKGFIKDLPDMNVGRTSHGCGSYLKEDNTQVFIVAGGGHGKEGPSIGSTEALYLKPGASATNAAWKMMDFLLPSPMKLPGMVTLGNKLYMAGGTDGKSRCTGEIFTWNDGMSSWDLVGRSTVAQDCVAAGTLKMTQELEKYC